MSNIFLLSVIMVKNILFKFIIAIGFIISLCLISYGNIFSQNTNINNVFDYLKNNKYNESLNLFNDLIKRNDTISNFYYGRGVAYLYLDNYDNAIDDFQKTIKLNPSSVDALYGLAVVYIKLEEYETAKHFLDKAIDIDSNYYELFYVRGLLNYLQNNYKNAINDFNYILEKRNNLNALYGRAITYYKLDNLLAASTDIDTFLQNNKSHNFLTDECHRLLNLIRNN